MRQTFILIISVLAIMLAASWSQQAAAQPEWGPPVFDDLDEMVEEDIVIGPGFDSPPMMEPMPQGEMPAPLIERLKLTDEQQTKLKELRIGVAKDMARLRADFQIARLDLMALLDQPSPKPEEARARAAKVGDAQAAVLQRMIAFQVAMKS
ncbi:MAG: periplasmic heavy metal sensor, partial [Candidatus Latescibacteria bacterium]|nr:periplasmic heavy metal sensor [Candidatus Latescibacterota bacterium]